MIPEGVLAAEDAVMGALISNPGLLPELELDVEDFHSQRHAIVFQAMRNLEAEGTAIDPTTLAAHIKTAAKLDAIGGMSYFGEVLLAVPVVEHLQDYARFVRDEGLRRRMIRITESLSKACASDMLSGRELLDRGLAELAKLDREGVIDDTQKIGDLAREHVKYLEAEAKRRQSGESALTGYTTGVEGLDNKMGGWQPGIVSVVCARPGHGKSTLLLATADECSAAGHGVHVFSMEDPRKMYMNRVIARHARIHINRIQTTELTREDLPAFAKTHHHFTKTGRPWLVDDRSGLTSEEIVRSVRRHRAENGTKVVIVDYLQLVKRPSRSLAKSRHEVISECIHELADAAKNDGMAYVVASQLNRDLEKREDKRPQESDLRESGTIEERAKCIVGIYRGRRYTPDPVDGIDLDEDGNKMSLVMFERTVQLLIMKNSQGPAPERVVANWSGETARVW